MSTSESVMLLTNLMNLELPSRRESREIGLFEADELIETDRLPNQNTQAEDTSEPSTCVAKMSQDYVQAAECLCSTCLLFPHPSKFLFIPNLFCQNFWGNLFLFMKSNALTIHHSM